MRTMHYGAALKVKEGITAVEEAARVLQGLSVPVPDGLAGPHTGEVID